MSDPSTSSHESDEADASDASFRFAGPGLTVEFAGSEEFVAAQVARVLGRIKLELQLAVTATPRVKTPPATPRGSASLPEFYKRVHSREGRGALREMVLIFAYFLREYRGESGFSIDNISACFDEVGTPPPRNLANTLGIMKRTHGFFDARGMRGHYALTEKGVAYVARMIGAR